MQALASSPVGELVPISGVDHRYDEMYRHVAFVPAELPMEVELSSRAWNAVSQAQEHVARLDGAVADLPDPMLVVRPLIRREARTSSALEGTHTGFAELLGAEELEDPNPGDDLREVLNYVRAAETAIARLEELPICMRLVNEAHEVLLAGVRGDGYATGRPRSSQNWIGPEGCRIEDAVLVPPPPDAVDDALAAWEAWLHRSDLPVVLRAALAHYQFETIHPYTDGNGRIGRLVVILQMIESGLLRHHLMTISSVIEAEKGAYTTQLQRVRETGDYGAWVEYFCSVVSRSARDALDRIRAAQAVARDAVSALRDAGAKGVVVRIAEDLTAYPLMTVKSAATRYDVTYATANTAVARLCELGVLQQLSEGNYARVFASPRMVQLFA